MRREPQRFFFHRSAVYIAPLDDISSSHEDNEVSAIITGNDTRLPVANQFALAFMVASPAARPVVRGIVVGIMVALPGREHHDYPTTHAHTPSRLLTTAIREGFGLDHPRIVLATTTTITTTTAAAAASYYCYWILLPSLETGRRITGAYCRPLRSALLGYVESRDAPTSQLVPCNCASIVSIIYSIAYAPQSFLCNVIL